MAEHQPWFPKYVDDWRHSRIVRGMTWAQRGLFDWLLCEQWADGGLPADKQKIARVAGASVQLTTAVVDAAFPVDEQDGLRRNLVLEKRRKEQLDKSLGLSKAGKKGAAARWQGHSGAIPQGHSDRIAGPMAKNGEPEPEPEPDTPPTQRARREGGEQTEPAAPEHAAGLKRKGSESIERALLEFRESYPRFRLGTLSAVRTELTAAIVAGATIAKIIAGLEDWKTAEQWRKSGGQYIPNAAKWLQQRSWESAPAAPVSPPQMGTMSTDYVCDWPDCRKTFPGTGEYFAHLKADHDGVGP